MVGMPIVLTKHYTIAGFASLCWTDMVPMRQMGIFVSLGIFYAGVLSLFFLPAVLSRIELPSQTQTTRESNLPKVLMAASRHKIPVIAAFVVIVVVSSFYIPRLEVVSNQLMFFKEDSSIRQTFDKIEKYFGGALPLTAEIVADRGLLTLRDYRYADTVLDIERSIERMPGVKSVFSPFDMIANLSEKITGKSEYPENAQFIQMLIKRIDSEDLEGLVSADGLKMVIRTENLDDLDIAALENLVAVHPEIRLVTGMPCFLMK
jgi:predicted RND superfamily exporter protein